ncbi:MAG: hypothetical protein ACRD4W_04430 [Nitrososphaeraceae archaeon]
MKGPGNETTSADTADADADDIILMDKLRRKDERLTVVMFDALSDPNEMLNFMLKKHQLYEAWA